MTLDRRIVSKGFLVVLGIVAALALMGALVSDSWTYRPYETPALSHDRLSTEAMLSQFFDVPEGQPEAVIIDIARTSDADVRGTFTLSSITPDGLQMDVSYASFSLSERLNGDSLSFSLPPTERGIRRICFTLEWQDDGAPAVWTDAAGQPCMRVQGLRTTRAMVWYWSLCGVSALGLAAYVLHAARLRAQGRDVLPLRILAALRKYRFLLEQLVRRNFNTKYRQSVLGVLWSFLNPLLTMAVQYMVFSTIFRSEIPNFPVYLITGIILFSFFTEAVTLGMDAIVMNGPLLTKVAIPKLIFPVSRTLSSLISLGMSFLPLLLIMLLTGVMPTPALLLLPLLVALLLLFTLGITLILSTMNVFFRDTRFLWSVVSLLWTYATPIFYPESILPELLRPLFRFNPMYQYIDFLRQITLYQTVPAPQRLGMCVLWAAVSLFIGLTVFRRSEDQFVFHL